MGTPIAQFLAPDSVSRKPCHLPQHQPGATLSSAISLFLVLFYGLDMASAVGHGPCPEQSQDHMAGTAPLAREFYPLVHPSQRSSLDVPGASHHNFKITGDQSSKVAFQLWLHWQFLEWPQTQQHLPSDNLAEDSALIQSAP
jgi:hypothetical protein